MTPRPSTPVRDCARTKQDCARVAVEQRRRCAAAVARAGLCIVLALAAAACGEPADPARARAAYDRGVAHAQSGRIPDALADLQIAIDLEPRNAEAHVLYAVLTERTGDLALAEQHLRIALEAEPENADAPLHLARVLRKRSLDQEIEAARRALTAEGPTSERLVALGDLLRARERFDDALIQYLGAERIGGPSAAAHAGLGLAYSQLQRQVRALYHLSEAVRLDPAQRAARDEIVWILATSSHADLRDTAEAIRMAEAVIEDPAQRSTRLVDALAAAWADVGRFEEARNAAGAAIGLAEAAGDHVVAHQIRERLRLYEASRPFIGPPVDPL